MSRVLSAGSQAKLAGPEGPFGCGKCRQSAGGCKNCSQQKYDAWLAKQVAPSTPAKRRRLERHLSDEKENLVQPLLPIFRQPLLPFSRQPPSTSSKPIAVETMLEKARAREAERQRERDSKAAGSESQQTSQRQARSPLHKVPVTARPPLQLLQSQPQDRHVAGLASPLMQPDAYPLVGREQECGDLDRFLDQSLGDGAGKGRCLYISGGPGTGKTCSVRASINNYRRFSSDTCVLEVNCMDLTQRSVSGVLQQLLLKINQSWSPGRSMQGLATLAASSLAEVSKRVVIVVDEVDQLVSRSGSKAAAGALSLETLFSLPRLPGAPAVAIIAIANAVDLLERTTKNSSCLNCSTVLFEPYSKDQLKSIVTSRVKAAEGGDAALQALGGIKVQLRVTQVAKESGDCRQVMSLIEEALFEAKSISEAARSPTAAVSGVPPPVAQEAAAAASKDVVPAAALLPRRDPRALIQSNRNDPLQAIQQLPLEQQILLATLATSNHEATKLSDVCKRYKELCRDLKQPENLGSKGQVSSALSALEHRGLLAMHCHRGVTRGRGKQPPMATETTVELWVACGELLKSVIRAKPELAKFIKAN